MTTDRRRTPRGLLTMLATTLLLGGGAVTETGCSDCGLRVSTRMLPDAVVGIRYDVPLTSNCGGDAWFLQTGTLPPGIGLEEDGDLAGIPPTGTYTFTVGVFDFASGATGRGDHSTVGASLATATPG
jgi:hypothetical protein